MFQRCSELQARATQYYKQTSIYIVLPYYPPESCTLPCSVSAPSASWLGGPLGDREVENSSLLPPYRVNELLRQSIQRDDQKNIGNLRSVTELTSHIQAVRNICNRGKLRDWKFYDGAIKQGAIRQKEFEVTDDGSNKFIRRKPVPPRTPTEVLEDCELDALRLSPTSAVTWAGPQALDPLFASFSCSGFIACAPAMTPKNSKGITGLAAVTANGTFIIAYGKEDGGGVGLEVFGSLTPSTTLVLLFPENLQSLTAAPQAFKSAMTSAITFGQVYEALAKVPSITLPAAPPDTHPSAALPQFWARALGVPEPDAPVDQFVTTQNDLKAFLVKAPQMLARLSQGARLCAQLLLAAHRIWEATRPERMQYVPRPVLGQALTGRVGDGRGPQGPLAHWLGFHRKTSKPKSRDPRTSKQEVPRRELSAVDDHTGEREAVIKRREELLRLPVATRLIQYNSMSHEALEASIRRADGEDARKLDGDSPEHGREALGTALHNGSNKLDEVDELMFIEGRLPAAWSLVEEPSRPPRLFGEKLSSATLAKITDGRDYDDLGRAAYPGDLHRISVEKAPGNKGVVQACIRIGRELAPGMKVIVVDRNDELGGASSITHASLGPHVQVLRCAGGRDPAMVIMRGIRCFTPRVMVVDELSTAKEAEQAIQARRSNVSLVATIHGDLKEFTANKNLQELAGKIRESTVSDVKAASASFGWQKSFRQREQPSTFDVKIEIVRRNHWIIYHDVDAAIDACLGMTSVRVEHRRIDEDGVLIHWFEALSFAPPPPETSKVPQEGDEEDSDDSDDDFAAAVSED
ncbi:hypothetical protein BDZ88DRAFT_449937 [Geranomyces variabilis]|nr:hypothetical protein BDZ88DRAFT_449937 [Geranomyces variabilis]KAJ3133245.1 Uncharacterized protein HDU90_006402 [Geranomyces variabilis]